MLLAILISSCSQKSSISTPESSNLETDVALLAVPEPFNEANIDWRQYAGTTITVELLTLAIASVTRPTSQFTDLTGIEVDYQIYPEAEESEINR